MPRNKNISTIAGVALKAMILLVLLTPFAWAADDMPKESDFIGIWNGNTIQDEILVELTVAEDAENSPELSYEFHFDNPHNCFVTAVKNKLDNNILKLNIKKPSGGKCDKLRNGTILLKMLDEKRIEATVKDRSDILQFEAKVEKR